MGPPIRFTVPGKAQPQGSKRSFVVTDRFRQPVRDRNGRVVVNLVEDNPQVGPWRQRVALAARVAMRGRPLLTGAVSVHLDVVLPRPKSTPRRTPQAVKRPDADKLARAIFDAITGPVIADDSQVVHWGGTKRLAEAGEEFAVHVTVRPVLVAASAADIDADVSGPLSLFATS